MMAYKSNTIFLTAEWKHLAIINYLIDPGALKPYIPYGTELDIWNGNCYLSLVGFRFLNSRIKGIPVPHHKDFEEINLRFYVSRSVDGEIRRGVVFIKEIVPKQLVVFVANKLYKENYIKLKTRHSIDLSEDSSNRHVSYSWQFRNRWNNISLIPEGNNYLPGGGCEAEFITEHYWGYSSINPNTTLEYMVQHPKWSLWNTGSIIANINFRELYGTVISEYIPHKPHSAYIAEGSEISVSHGRRL